MLLQVHQGQPEVQVDQVAPVPLVQAELINAVEVVHDMHLATANVSVQAVMVTITTAVLPAAMVSRVALVVMAGQVEIPGLMEMVKVVHPETVQLPTLLVAVAVAVALVRLAAGAVVQG